MLPNGFCKNLEEIDANEIEFICYGVPRSGTTLVYQLICGIYPKGVAKTHRYCRHLVKTVVSYRDFRDITVSVWRRTNPKNLRRQMNRAEVEEFAALCQQRIKDLDMYFDRGGICPLRYEEFVKEPKIIFSAVEKTFGVVVSAEKMAELVDKYSLEKNREISDRLGGSKQIDPTTQIHGNHIYRGEIGSWRRFVSDRNAERLDFLLRPSLLRYGYL
jgi:hypothetical protein